MSNPTREQFAAVSPSELASLEPPRPDMVTSVIQHVVKRGAESEYESWLKNITPIAARFPGHQGIDFIAPPEGSRTYTVILRFDTMENAQNWFQSTSRRVLMSPIQPH